MTQDILDLIKRVEHNTNIPAPCWYAICMNESGGNPNSRTYSNIEDSRGLFQINIYAWKGYVDISKLYIPSYNITFAWKNFLKKSYDEAISKGLKGVDIALYMEHYGERPQWTSTVENNIRYYYNYYINHYSNSQQEVAVSNSTKTKTVIAHSGLNVRENASPDAPIIGLLKYGETVKIDSTIGSWTSIYFGQHGGYVATEYLR